MVERHVMSFSRDLFEGNGCVVVAARSDHDAELSPGDDIGGGGAEVGGEDAIFGGRSSTALYVTKDGHS